MPKPPTCTLCALDGEAGRCLQHLGAALGEAFGIEVHPLLLVLSTSSACDPSRGQLDAPGVLAILDSVLPPTTERAIAITSQDLSTPVLSFVLGVAEQGGRMAVMSIHRLRNRFYGLPDDPAAFFDRVAKLAVHQMGHLFGLNHCATPNCPMHHAASVEDLDLFSPMICPACRRGADESREKRRKQL